MALLIVSLAQAQIPRTISYQGYLTNGNGAATNSAGLVMVFNLYSVPTGGTALHHETQSVTVSSGIFNVLLGTTTALLLPFDAPYYLGVTVGNDAEMLPRRPLATSPYAIRAASADTLAASAVVPGTQIANASISAAKLASSSCSNGQVLQYNANGSAWVCTTLTSSSGGTVTSITAGTGLTGGTITESGTLGLASNLTLAGTTTGTFSGPLTGNVTGNVTGNISGSAGALATSAVVPGSQIADASLPAAKLASNSCTTGQALQYDGTTWVCASPAASSGGTVTSINTGPGLIGGPITTAGTVSLASSQLLPITSCASGQTAKWNGAAWLCAAAGAPAFNAAFTQLNNIYDLGVFGLPGDFPSITVGADGLPVITYINGGLRVVKCATATCSGSNRAVSNLIDQFGGFYGSPGSATSIILGNDGLPVISYTSGSLKVAKCGDAACSLNNVVTAVDASGPVFQYSSIAISADGRPVIAYYDSGNKALKVAKCSNPSCSASTTFTVDTGLATRPNTPNGATTGQYTSIAIGTDGLPIISYFDGANLRIAKCGNAACSANNIVTTATFSDPNSATSSQRGVSGQYSAITINTSGLPIISFYASTGTDSALVNITCLTATCACPNPADSCTGFYDGNSTFSELNRNGGQYGSITIGSDGLPVISYYDASKLALNVAKCQTPDCVGALTFNTVDTGNRVRNTSITIGSDGLPLIAYVTDGGTNTTPIIRVAKCGTAGCRPFYRRR